ncbi:prefoldin subunit [Dentipellis sp. KUC8613]|nr:prefoldin subunit [Dentipellis sp. KUC8613]
MASAKPQSIIQEEKNPRGIPKALFINDVEEYLGGPDAEVEKVLNAFQDALAKYRYMDSNLTQRRRGLEEKIPDIKKTLSMVEFLRDRREGKSAGEGDEDDLDDLEDEDEKSKPLKTTFELADTLYAEAELEETDTVYIWLGANVMLSYKIPAAIDLLSSKLDTASTSLKNTIEDLEFLREQLTVMEVNTARVYNWDVKRRREKREREQASGSKAEAT